MRFSRLCCSAQSLPTVIVLSWALYEAITSFFTAFNHGTRGIGHTMPPNYVTRCVICVHPERPCSRSAKRSATSKRVLQVRGCERRPSFTTSGNLPSPAHSAIAEARDVRACARHRSSFCVLPAGIRGNSFNTTELTSTCLVCKQVPTPTLQIAPSPVPAGTLRPPSARKAGRHELHDSSHHQAFTNTFTDISQCSSPTLRPALPVSPPMHRSSSDFFPRAGCSSSIPRHSRPLARPVSRAPARRWRPTSPWVSRPTCAILPRKRCCSRFSRPCVRITRP